MSEFFFFNPYLTQKKRDRFIKFCSVHLNIIFIIEGFGVSDIDLDLEMPNPKRFHDFIMDLKHNFGEIIKDYEILLIAQEVKAAYLSPIQYVLK